jgi:ATP-dependent helicase/nuclease subunit B
MDPAARGELYHAVQFELLRTLAGSGGLPVTAENLPDALAQLDLTLENVAGRFAAKLAPAIPQVWQAEVRGLRADLRGWLQQRAAFEPDWTPQFYELSFGLKDPVGRDPHSRREAVAIDEGFQLQGSIDLVEKHGSGVLRVVDHKTGRIPEPRPEYVGGGELLQPALYALAAEKMLDAPVSFGRLYYSTIAQNYATVDVPLNDWVRHRALQVLRVIDDSMRNGFLPAAPRKDGCKHCDYLPVCGPYEEERADEKSQPELKSLKELRTWR